jgi:hypothetical protein
MTITEMNVGQYPRRLLFPLAGIARLDTREMSSLSTEQCEGASFIATLFEIPIEEFPALEQREAEFVLAPVVPEVRGRSRCESFL